MNSGQLASKSLTELDLLFIEWSVEYHTLLKHAIDFNYIIPDTVYHTHINRLNSLLREFRLRVPAYTEHM